jgi:hypothetical protein
MLPTVQPKAFCGDPTANNRSEQPADETEATEGLPHPVKPLF